MHPTAYENATVFYMEYILPIIQNTGDIPRVVEFGSYDVNGSMRPIFQGCEYIGIDLTEGKGVDVVCSGEQTPFPDASVDAVLSSSNFEHDECFWMTFLEMCRILKPGRGMLYINAPSAGPYHGYPGDCWRFYKDSWTALAKWAKRYGYEVEIVETYVDMRGGWQDNVCVFMRR
jgi:predicted SAM-dependent methyltransferase